MDGGHVGSKPSILSALFIFSQRTFSHHPFSRLLADIVPPPSPSLPTHLEHALHVLAEDVRLAHHQHGHGQPEDDLHAVREEPVHDAAGQRQRQRRGGSAPRRLLVGSLLLLLLLNVALSYSVARSQLLKSCKLLLYCLTIT